MSHDHVVKFKNRRNNILAPSFSICLKTALFWIWIGLMLAVVSRLFFYKNIARHLLRKFANNCHKYKANFLWWFPANLRVFIVCEANYSYQFCYLIKKCPDYIQSEELIARRRLKKETTIYVTYSFKYCALIDICR